MATPSPTVFDSTSCSGFLAVVSPKNRLPVPSTTGNTIRCSSSTRSCSSSACASCPLPCTYTSPLALSRTFDTASTTSPERTVVLFHSGSRSVDDTTYFGMLLNLSAKSPVRDGHASAKPSYVTRPSSSASDSSSSSTLNLFPSSPRSISNVQPPYLKSSAPPGSSITPSSDTNSVTTILPISLTPPVA